MPLQVFPDYADYKIELLSPLEGTVYGNSTYNFSLSIGEGEMSRVILYEYASIVPPDLAGSVDFSETTPGLWELTLEIPAGLVQLNLNILPLGELTSITVLKYQCIDPSVRF